jgi:hypothetical protein
MTQKEIFNIVFKFSALLVFALLFNKSIESRPFNHFEGSLPLKGEKTIVMEMDGDFDLKDMDLDKTIDIKKDKDVFVFKMDGDFDLKDMDLDKTIDIKKDKDVFVFKMDGDFDLETMDLDKISDITVDGESIEIMINGKTISLPLDKMTEMKDNQ